MSNKTNENGVRKFGMRDKLAYAAGDFGCCCSFALKTYISVFWTQFMGVSLTAMAAMMLIVQVWDGINDPIIGAMVDRDKKQYKRNKFLQYIWVGSIGLAVAGSCMFLPIPNAPMIVKYALFIVGYLMWDAFYTIANVPYGSVMSLITTDAAERAELSTFRTLGSMVANIGVGVALPMFIYKNNELQGNTVFAIALIMGLIGFCFFQFMIRNTTVRVNTEVKAQDEELPKMNIFKSFGSFLRNRAAVGATLAVVGQFIGMYGAQYATTVVWQSYFKNASLSGLMGMISYLPMFLFMPFIKKIVGKWGKKEAVTVGATVSMIGYCLLVVLPITPDAAGIAMWVVSMTIAGIGGGVYSCVSWSLMADAMDYGEWKFGVREEGTTYALHSFFRKLAQGVGPSCGLLLASALGYVEADKGAQAFEVAVRMRYLAAGSYAVSGIIMFISLVFIYNLNTKFLNQIHADLEARKAAK